MLSLTATYTAEHDRVGCSRRDVKAITHAFNIWSRHQKLGHSLHPELSDAQKKKLGSELTQIYDAIPGLEPLIEAVKQKVRSRGRCGALMAVLFSAAEHNLNYLLQSAGAILSKRWLVISQELINNSGLTYNIDYTRCAYVHDEQQLSVIMEQIELQNSWSRQHQPVTITHSEYQSLLHRQSEELGENPLDNSLARLLPVKNITMDPKHLKGAASELKAQRWNLDNGYQVFTPVVNKVLQILLLLKMASTIKFK